MCCVLKIYDSDKFVLLIHVEDAKLSLTGDLEPLYRRTSEGIGAAVYEVYVYSYVPELHLQNNIITLF